MFIDNVWVEKCPFCGEAEHMTIEYGAFKSVRIVCDNCDVIGPVSSGKFNAIKLWNEAPRQHTSAVFSVVTKQQIDKAKELAAKIKDIFK